MTIATCDKTTGVLQAIACLVGASVMYWYDLVVLRLSVPFLGLAGLIVLLGLVLLWRAFARTMREAFLSGVALMLAGVVSIAFSPFTITFGALWLIVIGMAFPVCLGLVTKRDKLTGVLQAFACFIGAVVLYMYDVVFLDFQAPFYGARPWLVLLLGLMLLWRALDRTMMEAVLVGGGLMLAGVVAIACSPFTIILGSVWLIVIGFALPFCVGVVTGFPRRPPAQCARSGVRE